MITLFLVFIMLIVLLTVGICFHLVGGVLKLVLKLVFCLPCALLCGVFGVMLCCTLILIPLGIGCFKMAGWFLNPFKFCIS